MTSLEIATTADIESFERVPIKDRLEWFNTYDMLLAGAGINPEATAISFLLSGDAYDQPMVVTYRDLMANIHRTANLLYDLGVGPTDVVTYLLPNLPHTHYALWGAELAGIANPINPLLEPHTMAEICRAAKTKAIIALGEFPGSDIWQKVEAIRGELPDLKAIVRVMGPSDERNGIYGFDEVIGKYDGEKLDSGRQIDPDDVASFYHTGGTTGTPKIAPRTHFNEAVMAFMMSQAAGVAPGEVMLCGLPLFHANGTTVTGSVPFSKGAHVVLLSPRGYRDPSIMSNFFKIVEHYQAATFSCVPTVLSVLLENPVGDVDISSLRFAVCGAAPLSVELFTRFEEHSGMKILEGYGLTEGACASSANPQFGERKIGSIGLRLPYQEMDVMIVDDEGRFVRRAETDEIGVVCIKGPNVFGGYLDPVHNEGLWPQGKEAGWMNTGDLGRRDEDEFFWLTGRRKELIIRGGHNIDPALVEEPLYRLQGVHTAAAVGKPDFHAGEVPVAYVQLQDGAALTEPEILDYLKEEIGERAAVPKEVHIIDEIPLTPVGKIFKPALRWDSIRRVYERELEALGDMAESVRVSVGEHKVHGSLVDIKVKPAAGVDEGQVRQKVSDVLTRHTVRWDLEVL